MAPPDRLEPSLVSQNLIDRIVAAIERGDQDGLKKGYDQAIFRRDQLPPPQAYGATPSQHRRRAQTEQLIHLLAIAIGWYDGTLHVHEKYAKRHPPADAAAELLVIATRRRTFKRSP